MKTTKKLLALSILAASQLHATPATYSVTGSLDGVNTMKATVDPKLYVHTGSTTYSTTGVSWPSFTGSWVIDTSVASITGTFADFVQYSTSVNAGILGGTAVVNQPDLVYLFQNGTVVYTPDLTLVTGGTLTVGQTMVYSNTDSTALNNQTSDGTLEFNGTAGNCYGSSTICSGQSTWFLAYPDVERFYLTLTFSADMSSFTGTAVGADVGGSLPLGTTGNTWYSWSFTGTVVP